MAPSRVHLSRSLWLIFLVTFGSFGCGGEKTFVSESADDALDYAMGLYREQKYSDAIQWFQRTIFDYPGDERIDQAMFYLGDSYYEEGDYLMAASEFKRLTSEFPDGALAMKAYYRLGQCYGRLSPDYQLDQTDTRRAIQSFNTLIQRFPGGIYADSARMRVSELEDKLARKEFENGYFYYKRRYYDSAIIQFETVREDYSGSSWLAPTLYYLSKAYDKLDLDEDAGGVRMELIELFPDSEEARKVLEEYPSLVDGSQASAR